MALHVREGERRSELEIFTKKVAIVIGFVLFLALVWFVRDVLILVVIAAILAAGISPAVRWVQTMGRFYFHRRVHRGTAVFLVYTPFLILVLALAIFLVPRLISETRELGAQLPTLIETNILTPLDKYMSMDIVR